jgi:hypothetical protein
MLNLLRRLYREDAWRVKSALALGLLPARKRTANAEIRDRCHSLYCGRVKDYIASALTMQCAPKFMQDTVAR